MAIIIKSKKEFETVISKRVAEMSEQAISEMGAEIHDDLIQKLSIVGLYIDRLERSASNPEEIETLLISMRADFENVVQSVRRISRKLMPIRLDDTSLQANIELLCQNMERPGAGNIHLNCLGDQQNISTFNKTHLCRIVQELIHNAFKHSAAWHVWVHVTWEPNQLILEVEDDGTGFQRISEFIDKLRKKNNTLKMRSQVIGASITYRHGPKGLLAKVIFPL